MAGTRSREAETGPVPGLALPTGRAKAREQFPAGRPGQRVGGAVVSREPVGQSGLFKSRA